MHVGGVDALTHGRGTVSDSRRDVQGPAQGSVQAHPSSEHRDREATALILGLPRDHEGRSA